MKYLKDWLILNKKPLIYFIIIIIISAEGARYIEDIISCFGWGIFWGIEIEQHCLSKFQG